MGIESVK